MAKVNEIELDPKLLDGENVPYPCAGCSGCPYDRYYLSCGKWKKWYIAKWKEVTTKLKPLLKRPRKER